MHVATMPFQKKQKWRPTSSFLLASFESFALSLVAYAILTAMTKDSTDRTGTNTWAFSVQFFLLVATVCIQILAISSERVANIGNPDRAYDRVVMSAANAYCVIVAGILGIYVSMVIYMGVRSEIDNKVWRLVFTLIANVLLNC